MKLKHKIISSALALGLTATIVQPISNIQTSNSEVSAAATVINATRPQHEKIGSTFSKTSTVSRGELVKLSKYADGDKTNKNISTGIASAIVTSPVTGVGLSVASGTVTSIISAYVPHYSDNINATLKKSTKKKFKIKAEYSWVSDGGRQGYYKLTNLKFA
jgi:hypothetical protein